ncbi:MAG TPA: hypothetical protein VHV52_05115, partial [Gaiellaceae bacterium]|nr:hypothetical protein [Gaiellaceae bacterium]
MALRTRALRFWLAAMCALSIGVLYVAPTVEAILTTKPVAALPNVGLPVAWFPPLTPPKLQTPPKVAKVKPYTAPRTPAKSPTGKRKQTIPVVRESYSFASPASSSSSGAGTSSAYASSPVVAALAGSISGASITTDSTGTPLPITQASSTGAAAGSTDTSVGTDPPALAPGSTPSPAAPATDATSTDPTTTTDSTPPNRGMTYGSLIPYNDEGSVPPPTTTSDDTSAPTSSTTETISSDAPPQISSSTVQDPITPDPSDSTQQDVSPPADQQTVTPLDITSPVLDTTVVTPDDNDSSAATDIETGSTPAGPTVAGAGDPSDGSGSTATPGDSQNAVTTGGGTSSAGGTGSSGSPAGDASDGTSAPGDSSTSIVSTAGGTPDPADGAGNGRGPPAVWTVNATGSAVTVSVAGDELVVDVGGAVSEQLLASVSSLHIVGAASLDVDLSGGPVTVPISYDAGANGAVSVTGGSGSTWTYDSGSGTVSGGGISSLSFTNVTALNAGSGTDTLNGPAADSVWNVTGSGSGTVGGAGFSGFEYLVGAANNQDQFVFDPNGSISGGIDGGPGGYDTLVLAGGSYRNVAYSAIDPHSGSVTLDGNVINYAGLEPILGNTQTGSDQTYTISATDPVIAIENSTLASNQLELASNDSETVSEDTTGLQSLTIDVSGSTGAEIDYDSVNAGFGAGISIKGTAGSGDKLVGDAGGGIWELTDFDSGTYTSKSGPVISFSGIDTLQGGSGDDTFQFDLGGGLGGGLSDSGGTNTVSLAGLLAVTGTGSFTQTSNASATLSDATTPTDLSVDAVDFTSATLFFGVGYGTPDETGVHESVSTGDVGIAVVSDPSNGRTWAAATLNGSSLGTVAINTDASDHTAIDFSTLSASLPTDFSGLTHAEISAALTSPPSFAIANLASASATEVDASAVFGVSGTTDTGSVTGSLLTFTVHSLTFTVGSTTAGFSSSASSATIAALLPDAPISPASDSRWWLGADVEGLSGTLELGSVVSASVSSTQILVNTAGGDFSSGSGSPTPATALDWTTLGANDPFAGALTSAEVKATGTLDSLDLAGVAEGHAANVTISQTKVSDANVTDGELLTVAITGLVGTVGGSGFGVTVSGDLTVDSITSGTEQWVAAKGTGLALDIELAPLVIKATGTLEVNEATGTAPSVITNWAPYGLSVSSTGNYVDVNGAVTSIAIADFGTITVTQADVQRLDGVFDPDGATDGSLFTVTLNGISLEADADGATLSIDGGNLAAYALSSNTTSDTWFAINGSSFSIDAKLGPVEVVSSGVNFKLNSYTGATGLTDWRTLVSGLQFPSASYFELDATGNTTVTLPSVTATVGSFTLVRETGVTGPTGTGTGTEFKLVLSGTHVDAGDGSDLTFTLDSGTLDVYGFEVGTASWVALDGSNFTPDITIGPLTISAGTFGFTLNTESGTSTPITQWSSFGDLGGPTLAADSFDATADNFTISIGGFASVSAGHIDLSRTKSVTDPTSGVTGTLVALELDNVLINAGTDSAALMISGGPLDFYLFADGDTTWTAASGSGLHIDLTGGPVTGSADGGTFLYNTKSGPSTTQILSWSFARGPPSVPSQDYFDVHGGATSLTVSGLGSISVASFDIAATKGVTVAGGAPAAGDLFTFTLTTFSVQLGSGSASLTVGGASLSLYDFTPTSGSA